MTGKEVIKIIQDNHAEDLPFFRAGRNPFMNARQAAREAAKHIAELEDYNRRASQEIKGLNACIDSVIAGEKTYCDWCEERNECDRAETGTGCKEWWLTMDLELPDKEDADDESAGILSASPDC